MEVVVAAQLDDERFSASLDLADLVAPRRAGDVWNLRLVAGRRCLRLGTHLDGVTNRGEATEYPAAAIGERRVQPYYTVENNVSVRSQIGGERRSRAAEPVDEDAKPRLARRLLGPPAVLVHRLALRLAGAAPRRRQGRRPRRAHPRCCTRGGWAAPSARR